MPRREAEWLKDRKATLEACFKGLDIDGSGFIDLKEMRRIATRLSPESNLQEALELIRWYDANNDGKVSDEEFMRVMETVTGATSDADFLGVVLPILDEDFHDFHFGSGFKRPIDGEAYLQRTVLPTLREGLVKLLRVLGKEGLQTAAGVDWDEGKLPPGWRPFQALRWLGEWLREHDPERPKGPANWFCELSRAEKLALAFKHLDANQNGSLELEEMLVLGGKLSDELDYDGARKYLQSMDTDHDGSVSQEEFVTYMEGLMDLMPDDQTEQGIQDLLNALHLSMQDRHSKVLAVGNQVADRKTGLVPLSVLQRFAAALNPELDLQDVEAAPGRVGEGEVVLTVRKQAFVEVLQRASQAIEDERELDSILGRLLARPELNVLELQADLHPAKFSLLVRSLPQHGAVKQMDTDGLVRQLQRAEAEPEQVAERVLLVDVRSPEEQEVSQIPGALSCPLLLEEGDDAAVWQSESRDLLLQRIDSWCAHSNVLVVKYCNTGERGNLSAKLLQEVLDGWPEALEKVHVVNLYGGIINWYNCGLPVLDPAGAIPVEKVHPGQRRYMGFFLRSNEFAEPPQDAPAEAAEQEAAEREAQRMRDFKQRQSTPPAAAAAQA